MSALNGRKIRFGIIGCGRIAAKHFEAIARHGEHAELVAVCDTSPTALRDAVAATGARGYAALGDMLKQSDCDIVVLCTPSGLHSSQAIAVARSGRHVMTEKPMATRWADGIAMVRACDEEGVRLFVVKQNRRNP